MMSHCYPCEVCRGGPAPLAVAGLLLISGCASDPAYHSQACTAGEFGGKIATVGIVESGKGVVSGDPMHTVDSIFALPMSVLFAPMGFVIGTLEGAYVCKGGEENSDQRATESEPAPSNQRQPASVTHR